MRWGGEISGQVQECVLNFALAQDTRVSAPKSAFVAALEVGIVTSPAELAQLKGGVDLVLTLVPAELNLWLEERHADLHEALLTGDSNQVLELTAKLSDVVEQMEMTDGMLP